MKVEMGLGSRYSHFSFKAKVMHCLLSMFLVMKQQAFGLGWVSSFHRVSDDHAAGMRDCDGV